MPTSATTGANKRLQKNVFIVTSLEFVASIDFFLVQPEIGKTIPSAAGLLVADGQLAV
jgi:hypothetical protein